MFLVGEFYGYAFIIPGCVARFLFALVLTDVFEYQERDCSPQFPISLSASISLCAMCREISRWTPETIPISNIPNGRDLRTNCSSTLEEFNKSIKSIGT